MQKRKFAKLLLLISLACLLGMMILSVGNIHNIHTSLVSDAKNILEITGNNNTLYVGGSGPNNYTKIQDAIDNASDGDTVFVYNGTYHENVIIDKSINLEVEGRNNTIINGGESKNTINIRADRVIINSFTITNGNNGTGIAVKSGYNVISENNIKKNNNGVYLYYSSNNTISGNNIIDYGDCGIWLKYSNDNLISGNDITSNNKPDNLGITIGDGCNNNIIYGNSISNNNAHGIYVGINFFNPGPPPHGNIISKNNITNNNDGIFLVYSCNNTIEENNITYSKTFDGIWIDHSSNNTISWNNIAYNARGGIRLGDLYGSSQNNIISYNNIIENGESGLSFFHSSNNNLLHHNNFINNYQNAYDECNNTWDNGYPSGGNYWSDYSGIDEEPKDGIGDVPYKILGGDNRDRYPLVEAYGNVPFYVKIENPQEGFFYFMGRKIIPFPANVVIGSINITVLALDKCGIERVEFYIDDGLKATVYNHPYYWVWDKPNFFKHTIKVTAFNNKNCKTDEITIWKFF